MAWKIPAVHKDASDAFGEGVTVGFAFHFLDDLISVHSASFQKHRHKHRRRACQQLHKKTPKTIVNGIKYVKTLPKVISAQLSISGFLLGSFIEYICLLFAVFTCPVKNQFVIINLKAEER